ncbi:MAG: hypothetical protein OXH75_06685 [Acidobacteria bacterium]|nr:hypothetical protein [Acidobacteriota bacterium]
MPEGLLAEARSAAAGGCLRVRLWPLPASAQLLRCVVSEVLGAPPADSLPLVVVSAADGVRSLRVAGARMDAHLELLVSDLVVGVPDGVAGDEPGHLLATVSSTGPAAERLDALRRGWGVTGSGTPWMRLTDTPVASASARCGPLGPRLAGTCFADGRLVFAGLDVDRGAPS